MKTPPKSSAKVYRDAAAWMMPHSHSFACIAIGYNVSPFAGAYLRGSAEDNFFEFLFRPVNRDRGNNGGWWKFPDNEPRILALLLAAEIVERGGLDK